MTTTLLDLTKITQEQVNEAKSKLGHAFYTAPCIIGAMLPMEQRERIREMGLNNSSVLLLATDEVVSFPDEMQRYDARRLQGAFDGNDWEAAMKIVNKYNPEISG